MNLYEIDAAIMACVNEDGEVIDLEKMYELQMARQEKVEGVALWVKNLIAENKALREEEMNLAHRRKVNENKVASLQSYLNIALAGQKFSTPRVNVSYRKSKSVFIFDEELVPRKYFKVKEEISKSDIADALKKGEEVPGCEIVEKENIQIK